MCAVRKHMQLQPYHNFQHVADVSQALFLFVQAPTAVAFLPSLHRFAVLLAAIMHDLDHPGYTNLCAAGTRLHPRHTALSAPPRR